MTKILKFIEGIHSALLPSIHDLKVKQMNVQYGLIQEFRLYEFKLGNNTTEATKNICCVKGEGKERSGKKPKNKEKKKGLQKHKKRKNKMKRKQKKKK